MERVATTLAGNAEQHHGQPRKDAEFRMEALGQSISEFDYTPESDITFDAWYGRYESLFSEDAVHLTEQEKTRLLLRKLNTRCHQIYINSILPQLPKDKSFIDTVTLLKSIFGRRESLFSTRYRCLQLNKSDLDDYNAYAAQVNKLCEEFKLAELTGDQFKCLMFVCGLQSHQYADIRTKILSAIDGPNAANVTLQNLVAECHRISNLKSDTAMVETHSVKAIQDRSANHQNKPKQHQATNNPQNTKQKIPKRPCWFCGEMHFSRYCTFKTHICQKCNKQGHKEGYCESKNNNNDTTASTYSKVTRVNQVRSEYRKYINVSINNVDCVLQIDTGSDITLISQQMWNKIGTPNCQPCSQTVFQQFSMTVQECVQSLKLNCVSKPVLNQCSGQKVQSHSQQFHKSIRNLESFKQSTTQSGPLPSLQLGRPTAQYAFVPIFLQD